MRTHISIKHAGGAEPIDLISEDLRVAWLDTMKKCFPHLNDDLAFEKFAQSQFSSQNGEAAVGAEERRNFPSAGTSQMENHNGVEEPLSAACESDGEEEGDTIASGSPISSLDKEAQSRLY